MFPLVLFYVAAGILLAALAIPMIQRRIKPNPYYGFRVSKAYQSDAVWYEINAYSGKRLLVVGIAIVVAALLLALVPNITVDTYAILIAVLIGIFLTVSLIQSLRYLNQIAK